MNDIKILRTQIAIFLAKAGVECPPSVSDALAEFLLQQPK